MEEQEIDLADYLSVLIKWKWLIAIGTLLCTLVALTSNAIKTPPSETYEARTSLLAIPPAFKTELAQPPFSIDIYKALAKAQDLEEDIIDSLQLVDRRGKRLHVSALDGMLAPEISSPKGPASSLLELVVTSSDSIRLPPVRIANIWAELFVKKNSGISTREALGSYTFINDQYQIARDALYEAEEDLRNFDQAYSIGFLKMELSTQNTRLTGYQTSYINMKMDLENKVLNLLDLQHQLKAMETSERVWVGTLDVTGYGDIDRDALDSNRRNLLDLTVRTRDQVFALQQQLRDFQDKNDLEFLNNELAERRAHLADLIREHSAIAIDASSMEEILKNIGHSNGNPEKRLPEIGSISNNTLREVASLQTGYNLYLPRQKHLHLRVIQLKSEIDSLEDIHGTFQRELGLMVVHQNTFQQIYQKLAEDYASVRSQADDLGLAIKDLRPKVTTRSQEVKKLHEETRTLNAKITDLDLKRSRKAHNVETYRSTFNKFAGLLEDARINKAEKTGDLKIVARAAEPVRIPPDPPRNIVLLAAGVGLILSIFLAFFLEYLEKAKLKLRG